MTSMDRRSLLLAAALASLAPAAARAQSPQDTPALSAEAQEISRWRAMFRERNLRRHRASPSGGEGDHLPTGS